MSRCLSEETLLLLSEGEGTREDRAHLTKCQVCTIRYQRLGKDLTLLGQVLREPPPRPVVFRERRFPALRWVPVAVAGVTIVVLLWGRGQWSELSQAPPTIPPPSPTAADEIQDEDLARFLAKAVGPAIFSTADLGVKDLPQRATSLSYLQAALDGGWPNERCEEGRTKDCDSDPFAQLFDQ